MDWPTMFCRRRNDICIGEPRGGTVRGYDTLFAKFLPALSKAGLSKDEITQLTVSNPAKAFSIGVRPR